MEIHMDKLEVFEPHFLDISNLVMNLTIDKRFTGKGVISAQWYRNLISENDESEMVVIQIKFKTWGYDEVGEGDEWLFHICRRKDFVGTSKTFFVKVK